MKTLVQTAPLWWDSVLPPHAEHTAMLTLGAQRAKGTPSHLPWNRAFWGLCCFQRHLSSLYILGCIAFLSLFKVFRKQENYRWGEKG